MSAPINNGGPAFPVPKPYDAEGLALYIGYEMTLRDYFAIHAHPDDIRNFLSNSSMDERHAAIHAGIGLNQWARYRVADAMIQAREAQP